jgi:hypothetical protein
LSASHALAAPNPHAPAVDPKAEPKSLTDASDVNWRQIAMAPRVTGNLRAVAVDPSDAKNIFIGTEEGTLIHSVDGGVTWDEVELGPFLTQSPTVPIVLSGDSYKAIDVFAGYKVLVGTTYYPYDERTINRRRADIGPHTIAPPFSWGRGGLQFPPFFINPVRIGQIPELVLASTGTVDPKSYVPVRRVRVCPGGTNTVFVSTGTFLLASPDGLNFVPTFFARASEPIGDVVCSPTNPNEVYVATGDGTFRSSDGGYSFDQLGGSVGPLAASTLVFGPPGDGGKAQLYVAAGRDLWVGDPSQPDAMHAATVGGEFTEIRHVAASEKSLWLATDTGVRVSRDGGTTWTGADDLEGVDWQMIAVTGPAGREHVAVMRADNASGSVDGGQVFRQLFRAQSRRVLRQVVALPSAAGGPPAFLLLTSGELWTTTPFEQTAAADPKVEELRRWAAQRLKQMASLGDTLDRAAIRSRLSDVQIDEVEHRLKARAWMPSIRFGTQLGQFGFAEASTATLANPRGTKTSEVQDIFHAEVELIWELPDVVSPKYQFLPVRKDLYAIRQRFLFAVEDAYQERRQVLAQIVAGGLDAEQVLTLQARLEVLDVVLQQLSGEKATP